ncbi:Kinesin-like protein KIN-13A [Camellia lanceoleosa]|uniref:Kinesin-like protein KIN-13A n=1 Tax=Camellia lanceoleosa TaxID=1840588 RepID=A0ACC0GGN3_9ERIC|nr:Kinesin-like protein KIN-13A [Camellia lanceoleosa]
MGIASRTLKILSYNVSFREDLEMDKRMEAIGDLIQLHSPDLICFQLSKLAVKSYIRQPFNNSIMGRVLCVAEVEVQADMPLVVASSHLESPCPKWDKMFSKERVDQAKEALNFLKKDANVVFCGDMNWDEELDGQFPLPEGWVDAWVQYRPGENGWTFDTKSNQMLSGNWPLQKRLDRFVCNLRDFKIRRIDMIGMEAIPGVSYCKKKLIDMEALPGSDAGDAVMARWLQSAGLQHLASPLASTGVDHRLLSNLLMQAPKRHFQSDSLSADLNYKSLYIDSKKKIVALKNENFELSKKLDVALGKIEAIVIGCDGIRSPITKWMGFSEPKYAGHCALCGLAFYLDGQPYEPKVNYIYGKGVHGGCVPVSPTKVYRFIYLNSSAPGII